ncbi:MAG TPA: cyclic pyranopterin monophosphate synthase MoaC [Deltaproteobacteria bacterium]|nr:cyclic pyranopterin monophosphate synthase MoaC [Deltaproteobacteria bacterium]HOM29796.1 cyclic pyranopterin monophosphate synthase MoaC [Deltaproteobacteria bacterium]HPP80184.1 cyclic pyranopterin monophosphate synthase MoaC [Deltaproteobacteria bacterium]
MALTHTDEKGRASMVDVSDKPRTRRVARASGRITMNEEAYRAVVTNTAKKGDVLAAARIAGIMAAKNTHAVIPLCHPLPIDHVSLELTPEDGTRSIRAEATVTTTGRTGVELEALHAVSVCLLTVYDMVKAVDRSMTIGDIVLEEKSGGKSGHYTRT